MEETLAAGAPCARADQENGGEPLFLWISSTLGHRFLCLGQ